MKLIRTFLNEVKKDLHWNKLNKSEKTRATFFMGAMVSFPIVACFNAWAGLALLVAGVAMIPNKLKI